MDSLKAIVNAADDGVFADFCRRLGVSNIREYEAVQLRAAEEETEARAQHDAQIARLTHQIKFEDAQLETTQERLKKLQKTIEKESKNVQETLTVELESLKREIEEAELALVELRAALDALKDTLDEMANLSDAAKKSVNKAVKDADNVQKEIGEWKDEIQRQSSERFAIYRRCKVEDISLPLAKGSLTKVPLEENIQDTDDDQVRDYGVEPDFGNLKQEDRQDGNPERGHEFEQQISSLSDDIEKMAPNLKAIEKLVDVESKLKSTERDNEEAKKAQKRARDDFLAVKKKRCDLFNKAFNHISDKIDSVYKDLTKGANAPMGGVAYLSLEDSDEPYLSGIKYHAMPPMKRFRDMEQLSGGEKTMAALALLFAIHTYQPSPFFVLDEVDAALDNTNVGRIASYIQTHSSPTFQFIVISLKGSL